jgi:hypothetical protein
MSLFFHLLLCSTCALCAYVPIEESLGVFLHVFSLSDAHQIFEIQTNYSKEINGTFLARMFLANLKVSI